MKFSATIAGFAFYILCSSEQLTFAQTKLAELKKLSLEQLMNIDVTTVSKRAVPVQQLASAVEILTADKIRRSGALTIPDLLRLATGIHVARSDGRTWAVSSRGLNLSTSNKMLVMVDGRSVYTPLFSGVFWDSQDYLLDDIDRIEIVRGPGATLWGSNAMNGVINILTKSAADTKGFIIKAGAGNEERFSTAARYGWGSEKTAFRSYFKVFKRDGLVFANGQDAQDDWLVGRAGFRMDSGMSPASRLTFQGDLFKGELGLDDRDDTPISGGNLLGRWTQTVNSNSEIQLQLYFDRTERDVPQQFKEERNTFDIDFQHRFQFQKHNNFVWGGNYRSSSDSTDTVNRTSQFFPADRTIHLFSGFFQDEITLRPQVLRLVVGSKFEHNTYTGVEIQPNIRLAWTPTQTQTIWTAVSRAVRIPARIDTDLRFFPIPGFLALEGNPDFESEELLSFEVGYRTQPYAVLTADVAVFYNRYDSLITVAPPQSAGRPPRIANGAEATIYGIEISNNFQPIEWLRVSTGNTFLSRNVKLRPGEVDVFNLAGEGNDPGFFGNANVAFDVAENWEFDAIFRYCDELPAPLVPGYFTMDFRIGFYPIERLELSISGLNLFQESHPEFGAGTPRRKEVERSIYGKVSYRF